jgi:hypothetical protein
VGGEGQLEPVGRLDALVRQDAGVVHQHVHGRRGEPRGCVPYRGQVGHVEPLERYARVAGLVADALRGPLAPLAATAQQDHLRTEIGERQRRLVADSRVGTGDEAAPARQVHIEVLGPEGEGVDAEAGPVEGGDDEGIDDAAQCPAEPDLCARHGELLIDRRGVLLERGQDLVDGRVVACLAARVPVAESPSGPDHEHTPELPGISLDVGLAEARAQCPKRVARQPGGEQLDTSAP